MHPFLSVSGNARRITTPLGSVFMPSIKNQETCTECCISSLGGQCSGTALPGHSPAPWASDHPGDSPGASLVSELGLCGWLGSTPAWFADSEKRHREGHLVPQGRSVADCSRAPWQRPPEKGREWSKRRTGRLRARRAPPSLILAAHDAAFRHSAAASGSHTHLRHRLAAADNLQTQPSPLSTNPHPRVAPCRPCSPSLARLLPLRNLAPLLSKRLSADRRCRNQRQRSSCRRAKLFTPAWRP